MHDNNLKDPIVLDGSKLWDEILKAIAATMPSQFFPLFKEVYGKEYPKETPVVLLSSETSSFQEDKQDAPGSTFMDIALLVANTDYYHLECQMKNNNEMIIRMFAYDVRFAITHAKTSDGDTGEFTLYFPHSIIIYPEKNSSIPDHLQCRVVFQDNSEHIYRIPTVKIQAYSLEEIHKKHLNLFIPYVILRLRPKLKKETKHFLTEKELTEFIEEVILVLKEELYDEYLTEAEYHNYVALFRFAVNRVLMRYPHLRKEASQMTEPLIKLPSVIAEEMAKEMAPKMAKEMAAEMAKEMAAEMAEKMAVEAAEKIATEQLVQMKDELANLESQIAGKDAEIQHLQELVNQLSSEKH